MASFSRTSECPVGPSQYRTQAELAGALTEQMAGVGAAGIRVIDVAALQARFAPVSATMPDIAVNLPAVASYDVLLPSMGVAA